LKKYTFINAMILSAALSGNVLADLNDGLVAIHLMVMLRMNRGMGMMELLMARR